MVKNYFLHVFAGMVPLGKAGFTLSHTGISKPATSYNYRPQNLIFIY